MIRNILQILVYCFLFLVCCIFGYVVYPFHNLYTIYILLVLIFYLCYIFAIDKSRMKKYALMFFMFIFVSHIMVFGTVLALSIGLIIRDDLLYYRPWSERDLFYPLCLILAASMGICCASAYYYMKLNNVNPERLPKENDTHEHEENHIRKNPMERTYTCANPTTDGAYEKLVLIR